MTEVVGEGAAARFGSICRAGVPRFLERRHVVDVHVGGLCPRDASSQAGHWPVATVQCDAVVTFTGRVLLAISTLARVPGSRCRHRSSG